MRTTSHAHPTQGRDELGECQTSAPKSNLAPFPKSGKDAPPANPQTLNLYAMVSDNPESFADLDGHCDDRSSRICDEPAPPPPPQTAQQQSWSLSWQVNASASFLGQELKGVYDTTLAPAVDAAAHPVQTVENGASNLVEGVEDVAKDPKGTLTGAAEGAKDLAVQFGSKVGLGRSSRHRTSCWSRN